MSAAEQVRLTHADCLEGPEGCQGGVEYRMALSSTGKSFARCDGHWGDRLKQQEEITRKYGSEGSVVPSDFDESYAGERWDEDY